MTVAVIFGTGLWTGEPLFVPRAGSGESLTADTSDAALSVLPKANEHAKVINAHTSAVLVNKNAAATSSAFITMVPSGGVDYLPRLAAGDVLHILALA